MVNIKRILSGILLSSLAAIPSASGKTTQQENVSTIVNSFIAGSEDKKKDQSKYSFVLPTNNRQLMLAAHSSHKSHSSHSSHSSHRSSSGGSSYNSGSSSSGSRLPTITNPTSTKSPSSGSRLPSITKPTQQTTPSPTEKPVSTSKPKQQTPSAVKIYQFWERELREGMSGNDVTQLTTLLISYNYLEKQKNEYKIYTAEVKKAVFAFQRDAHLPATGVCDKETAAMLKKWKETLAKKKEKKDESPSSYQEMPSAVSKENQTQTEKKEIKLGDRSLSIGAKGTDVDELIRLLKKNKFLLEESESTFFDLAVRDAIKKFQNMLALDETGTADKKTIKALQDYKVK